MQESDAYEDYKKLIKSVMDYSVTSYIKLQHPLNRKFKSSFQDFLLTLAIFYDEEYRFEHFVDETTGKEMSTKQMLSYLIDGASVSMENTRQHIIDESIKYWWEKNFHDIKIPNTFTIAGKVYKVINSTSTNFIDYENLRIYLPKKQKNSDRTFFKFVLEILLKELQIDLTEEQFNNLYKFFYLLLKVNNAFETR